jgi:hypothetical protein
MAAMTLKGIPFSLAIAVLIAGPIGYFSATRALGRKRHLILWAAILAIQTLVADLTGDLTWEYAAFNVPILALGLGLNLFGA